jgi:6-phosphogluconate dehydrogenase
LGKELIQGILHFRFSNNLLEKSWDNRAIEKIELRILETIGVENRGSFYDAVGALRDVGQNHLLEMLALITMDCPNQMNADGLRKERAKLLSKLVPWTKETLRKHTYRAQHTGYQSIEKVRPHSDTETYFRLKTELDHPLWRGVPIIIEAGKRCPEMQKDIVVTFKHPTPCVGCTADSHVKNTVTFSLTPDDQINIRFWTKKPGFEPVIEERAFTFFVREKMSKLEYAEEYAQLIDSCVRGDQTIFVSKDEVVAAWTFTDPIIEAWQKNLVPLVSYEPDSKTLVPTAEKHIPSVDEPAFPKTIGLIGLGKMGANVGRRLVAHGWTVSAYNRTSSVTTELAKEGLTPTFSLAEMTTKLPPRKIIWLMVPAGKPVDDMLFGADGLVHHLKRGDIIIDGGNSFYKDTILRAKRLAKKGIHLFDVGTSGGPRGALHGACLMIGGNAKVFEELRPLFRDLSNGTAYQFFSGTGAGHFVKMVHNGIEYGMMQAIAEGFALLKKAHFKLDLTEVASIYNNGSVIESRLTKWLEKAFLEHGNDLKAITGSVAQTGEGAWTAATAKALKIAAPIIEGSVKFRKQSEKKPSYTGKVLSALRGQFGGHATR